MNLIWISRPLKSLSRMSIIDVRKDTFLLKLFRNLSGDLIVKITKTLFQIVLLFLIYLLGNWIQKMLDLYIPGSIIGMLILFILLLTGIFKQAWVETGSVLLIKYLPLLFLPVTVGIISFPELLNVQGIFLIFVVLISTCLVMIFTGVLSQLLLKKGRYDNDS